MPRFVQVLPILNNRYYRSLPSTQRDKLNKLYTRLALGTPLASGDLTGVGISADLAVHYFRAGWLERLARRVYCDPVDPPALHPSIALCNDNSRGRMLAASRRSTGTGSAIRVPTSRPSS